MRIVEILRSFPLGLWLGIAGAIAFSVIWVFETRRHGLALIDRWAHVNGYKVVTAKRRTFVPLRGQWRFISFFRVEVSDAAGTSKNAWLRFHDLENDPKRIQATWDT